MDFNELLHVVLRTIFVLIILFFLTKAIGKKQVSQLNLFDYIFGITIGSIAADISLDIEKNIISGVVCLLIYTLFGIFVSYVTMKSINLRRFIIGVPTLLIEHGKIIESGLKKSKIDINELLMEARQAGYFNIDEVDYAIMESNGLISFLPKEEEKNATKKDVNTKINYEGLTANIIIDGKIMNNNLKVMNKNKKWLDHELKVKGYDSYQNILLCTLDNDDKLIIYDKNVKPEKNTILE